MNGIWTRFITWCERMIFKFIIALVAVAAFPSFAEVVTDRYQFTMKLLVPRTYDNMESLGYRKYQTQTIKGDLYVEYDTASNIVPVVSVSNLVNRTHKIDGKNITYECLAMSPRINLIGSNKTGVFKDGSINFYMDAEPSYSIGPDDEDNALLIHLAGRGHSAKKRGTQYIKTMEGKVVGTLGCGCKAYGHTSPTRVAGADGATDRVDDVAATFGSWSAKWKGRDVK